MPVRQPSQPQQLNKSPVLHERALLNVPHPPSPQMVIEILSGDSAIAIEWSLSGAG